MELQDLRLFVEVSKTQSFSRAAAHLHMGQPAVSQRIAGLEGQLGKPLFERHRHGVRLTEAGSVLLAYANRMLMLSDEAVSAVQLSPTDRIHIRLAAPSTVNSYLLPPCLTLLGDAGHDIALRDAHSHEVMQHLLDGNIDVGFVIDVPGQPGIRRTPIHTDPVICVTAPSHPLWQGDRRGEGISLSELRGHRIWFYRFSTEYDSLVGHVRTACGGDLHNMIETTPAESVKASLRTGRYVSFLPRMTVATELERGELREIPIVDLPVYTWNVAVAYRDRKNLPKAVSTVLSALGAIRRER